MLWPNGTLIPIPRSPAQTHKSFWCFWIWARAFLSSSSCSCLAICKSCCTRRLRWTFVAKWCSTGNKHRQEPSNQAAELHWVNKINQVGGNSSPERKTDLGRETPSNLSKGGKVLNWNYASSLRLPLFSTEGAVYGSDTKTSSAYLKHIQVYRQWFLGFEFHSLTTENHHRQMKWVWEGPPEASEDELSPNHLLWILFWFVFNNIYRRKLLSLSAESVPKISLPLYLATEQLSAPVSPLPYMDIACQKKWLHELQPRALFNSMLSGSSTKGMSSCTLGGAAGMALAPGTGRYQIHEKLIREATTPETTT